jgi:O-antigen/teichoic acid export membrane protein
MFWRGVFGYLPVNLVQALAGFGAILAFTRLLPPHAYGEYALAFSVSALVHTFLITWLEAAMARFHAAEAEGPDRAALFGTLYRAFLVFGVGGPLAATAVALAVPIPPGLKLALAAGFVSAIARGLLRLAQERRRAAGEVAGFAGIDMLATGGAFALGVLFAVLGFGAAAPLAGVGAASALCLTLALPTELRQAAAGRFDAERFRRYAAYGLPLSLSLALSLALASTDRLVLTAFVGEAATGAYHAGYSLSNRTLDVIFLWIGMAGGPAAVAALERGGEAALRRTALQQAGLLLAVAVPAAVGLALVAHPLAEVMVGPGLRADAARVTPWIAVGGLFSGLTTYYLHTAFSLARRTRRQMVAVAIPALANLALCLVLVPRFGLDGALWATVASYGVGMAASFALMQGCLPLPVPWGVIAKVAAASALMAAVVAQLPALGGAAELALKAAVGGLVYLAAVLVLDPGGLRTEALRRISASVPAVAARLGGPA